jgi:hypothetical protein
MFGAHTDLFVILFLEMVFLILFKNNFLVLEACAQLLQTITLLLQSLAFLHKS